MYFSHLSALFLTGRQQQHQGWAMEGQVSLGLAHIVFNKWARLG